jgi:5-methylcytosine-specific restriction enzyme A
MGSNGRPACLQCKGDITELRRSTFCSKQCSSDFRLKTDPMHVRFELLKRDGGICAICKKDCFIDALKFPRTRKARGSGDLWQADHIVPVIEGGGECGLDNYRTLCTACHKQETAALAKRRALQRRSMLMTELFES